MKLTIDQSILSILPDLRIGFIEYKGITISETPQMLKGRIDLFSDNLRFEYSLEKIKELPHIHYFQSCFKQLGIDPARYRPSSEALLRRILQGKSFPFIHSAADVNNFFSLRYLIPCGLYNAQQIAGDTVVMRLGSADESYVSLAGRETSASGKWVTADQLGPFGSPVIDSERTKVGLDQKNLHLLHIIYLPPLQEEQEAEKILSSISEMMLHVNGGEVIQATVIPSST